MKITESKARKLLIEEVDHLDPVTVFLEDFEPGRGRITIECYGKSWTSFWGAMSGRSISQFFCSCDEGYLSNNLEGNLQSSIIDDEKAWKFVKEEIKKAEKDGRFDSYEAHVFLDESDRGEPVGEWMRSGDARIPILFGPDWHYTEFPMMPNPDYEYLCRIINAVKEALKESEKPKPTNNIVGDFITENAQMTNSN